MTLRMIVLAAAWLTKNNSLKCLVRASVWNAKELHMLLKATKTRQRSYTELWGSSHCVDTSLSTVLAQDHFFSAFLNLHLTIENHKESMMMQRDLVSKISSSASAADLMTYWS